MVTSVCQKVSAEQIYSFRHQHLLWWHPYSRAFYVGDHDCTTAHWAVWDPDEQIVGCMSVYERDNERYPSQKGWQLRGVATSPLHRNKGIGRQMMESCLAYVRSQKGDLLWCNARTHALPFYHKNSFFRQGKEFTVEGVGPHFLMFRKINNDEP